MATRSLRLRLIAFAAGIMAATLVAAWFGLDELFTRHLERRVAQELDTHLAQLAGGLRFDAAGRAALAREPADPRFARIYGGLYWQALDLTAGAALRSRSLFDSDLPLPEDSLAPGAVHAHDAKGPAGEDLLVHERMILVPVAGADHQLRLSVAIDRRELDALAAGFGRDLAPALAVVGLVLLAGFALQIGAGLRPVDRLRTGVAAIRAGHARRLDSSAPSEIAPLVDEVNALLDAQEADIARARDRAADLAHGLKTPLTALAADIARLRGRGEAAIADDIDDLAGRMRRTVERELARARLRHGHARTMLAPALASVLRALARTPDGERIIAETAVDEELSVAVDADDLAEILGNLLENAFRHASRTVSVAAAAGAAGVTVTISDDGAGLDPERLAGLTRRGARLDETGTGLGLAIVTDILAAVGGTLDLGRGPHGGLQATMVLPG